ncbi:Dolichol kinase, partial [Geodia barretti]
SVPYWLLGPCVAVYSCLVPWLLASFPGSFTLCEAMMVGQGLSLLTTDTALQILAINDVVRLPEMFLVHRHQSLLFVEFLVFGVLMCCVLLSPALYKLAQAKNYMDHKFWSGTFILLSLGVGVLTVLRWLQTQLNDTHPIALVVVETFTRPVHLVLMLFWLMVTGAALVLVAAQSSERTWLTPLRFSQPGSLWMRKSFHLLAVLVFLPSLALSSVYLSLSSSISLFLFSALELFRYFKMWPGGGALHSSLLPLTDTRDAGSLILSHIYLLLGLSLPLWISPLSHHHNVGKLSLYSGVLSVGVGDSMAAVAGTLMGKTLWPGTKKTVEGSAMSVLTQLVAVLAIVMMDPYISMPTLREWGVVSASVVATAIMEAYTGQVDNLIIPLFQLAFFLSFL